MQQSIWKSNEKIDFILAKYSQMLRSSLSWFQNSRPKKQFKTIQRPARYTD